MKMPYQHICQYYCSHILIIFICTSIPQTNAYPRVHAQRIMRRIHRIAWVQRRIARRSFRVTVAVGPDDGDDVTTVSFGTFFRRAEHRQVRVQSPSSPYSPGETTVPLSPAQQIQLARYLADASPGSMLTEPEI